MVKWTRLLLLIPIVMISCNDERDQNQAPSTSSDSPINKQDIKEHSPLPPTVIYQNWKIGKPENAALVLSAYKVWDSATLQNLEPYLADTVGLDLPDGRRVRVTKNSINTTLGKWRKGYRETTNTPFSIISLYNEDRDQEWVIAWIWNRWRYNDGVRDSMLYCDNWRISNGKIEYLNSAENKPSKQLKEALQKLD